MTTAERRLERLRGRIQAITVDIRQAHADGDNVTAGILEQRRDEFIDAINAIPTQRRPGASS